MSFEAAMPETAKGSGPAKRAMWRWTKGISRTNAAAKLKITLFAKTKLKEKPKRKCAQIHAGRDGNPSSDYLLDGFDNLA